MDYKIDVSLSTNEVYTLTFNYTFDESVEDKTIRLEIGDLTIETQNRRVVFKTTSSATQIKSNVRLENVNLYEGNFLDYDQHGEYTKESYLKGMSLINLLPSSSEKEMSQSNSLSYDNNTGIITITFSNNISNFFANARAWDLVKNLKPSTYYTFIVEILENSLVDSSGNPVDVRFFDCSAYLHPSTQQPFDTSITPVGDSVKKYVIKDNAIPGIYAFKMKTVSEITSIMSADNVLYVQAYNGTLKARVMVIEGDYLDDKMNIHWFPKGIGCVKSPFITSIGNEQGFGKGGRL